MQNRRVLLSAIIKLLTLLGLLLLLWVFVNSLFTDNGGYSKPIINNKIPLAMIDLEGMQSGQIKKTRWDNKEVAVLLRQFPEKLNQENLNEKDQQPNDGLNQSLHPSLQKESRSKTTEYFVFFNIGDSKNCPLYYAGGIFKDICSSNKFDEAGRDIKDKRQQNMIEIPPHYFENNIVVFGAWGP